MDVITTIINIEFMLRDMKKKMQYTRITTIVLFWPHLAAMRLLISRARYKKILGSVVLLGKGRGSLYSNELRVEDACLKCPSCIPSPSSAKKKGVMLF